MTAIGVTTLYNPHQLKKEDLIRGFVARRPLLHRLMEDVRRETDGAPQHHLIIGQRGQGKTSLLRRLAFEIEDDETLGAVWKPLVFPEEQYNVSNLGDFWMNCVDAMSDALERAGDKAAAADLDARLASAGRGAAGLTLLLGEAARIGRRLMLLVDNIDIVLDRIGTEEEWDFRRVISSEPRLLIVGASSRAQEAFYNHGRAFYDFFQVHELRGLDDAETFQVLRDLAARTGEHQVSQLLDQQPGRIKALRELTGGNPRTLTLLFRVLAQGPEANVEADIEQLLDQYTPLYKDRLEDLPTQAQQVIDAMALHWDPLTAAMLADRVRLPVNQVSAQLRRLEDLGVVERADWHGEKKTAFQIAERFFNIWYLMRASRRLRKQLLWLVRFLESWFGPEQLNTHARDYLRRDPDTEGRQRFATMSLALSERIEDRRLRSSLEHAALHAAVEDERVRRMFDFNDLRPELLDKKMRMERMAALRSRVLGARANWGAIDPSELWLLLGGSPHYEIHEKDRIVEELSRLFEPDLTTLFEKLRRDRKRLLDLYWDKAIDVNTLFASLAIGEIGNAYDYESTCAVADREALSSMPYIAIMSRVLPHLNAQPLSETEAAQAEGALRAMANERDHAALAWNGIGNLLLDRLKRYPEAETAYRRAAELDPKLYYPWDNLGDLLQDHLHRFDESEAAYRRAIELCPSDAHPWNGLATLFHWHLARYAEAEDAYRRATKLDAKWAFPWNGLGSLLQDHLHRYSESEQAYRRAIDLDPRWSNPWNGLGTLLFLRLGRTMEAEAAFRKAIELDPKQPSAWNDFGNTRRSWFAEHGSEEFKRLSELEISTRRSADYYRGNANPWTNLGIILASSEKYPEAADAHLSALKLDAARQVDRKAINEICRRLIESARAALAEDLARRKLETAPDDPEAGFSLAAVLILNRKLDSARETFAILAANESALAEHLSTELFQVVVATGQARAAAQLLEQTGGDRRWRPLYEALRAAAEGDRRYLRRVAPEVRRVAEEIYDRIAPQKGEGAP